MRSLLPLLASVLLSSVACTSSTTSETHTGSVKAPSEPTAPSDPEPPTPPTPVESEAPADPPTKVVCGARAGATCGADEYCAYEPDGICGWADATSVCKARPEVCPMNYDPVCGCDKKEYANACAAASAGQGVLKNGDCKNLPGGA